MAEYIKYNYKIKQTEDSPELERIIALDETLIIHEAHTQIWIVGGIDTTSKALRLDIIPERNATNLAIFVKNHIEPGSNITYDGWRGYSFLNNDISFWTHEIHIHGNRQFGYGLHLKSHIEQIWGQIKQIIKKIYTIFPKVGYIYYIHEAQFRIALGKKVIDAQQKFIIKLLKNVYEICNYEFSSEEEIKDFNNYDY